MRQSRHAAEAGAQAIGKIIRARPERSNERVTPGIAVGGEGPARGRVQQRRAAFGQPGVRPARFQSRRQHRYEGSRGHDRREESQRREPGFSQRTRRYRLGRQHEGAFQKAHSGRAQAKGREQGRAPAGEGA
jgi:hypothetical protein